MALNSLWKALTSTIGQKLVVGLTGILLIGFVISHLAGNLLIYLGMDAYNEYAHALHAKEELLLAAEIGLLIVFILHVVISIKVSIQHKKARANEYAVFRSKQGKSPITPSSLMLVSGIIVLGFILLHLADLRFNLRHAVSNEVQPATHTLLVLQDPISATVYFFGSLFLGWHLWHAFQSAFQTYGLDHARYTPWIKKIGIALAVVLALGFASFPVWGILTKLGVLP
jgi:succinate dehydrogenase / fumarate reductase cytochrome b subunit